MGGVQLSTKLEQGAQFAHKHFAALAAGLIFAVFLLLGSDQWFQWVEKALSFAWIEEIGENIGKIAFFLGFTATLYYGMREAFVTAHGMKLHIPVWLDSLFKYWIRVLRFLHPLVGMLVFSAVLLHGYVMWWIWAAGNFSFPVQTGLTAAGILVLGAVSGLGVRWRPKRTMFRYMHRFAGFLFVLSFVVHRIVAD